MPSRYIQVAPLSQVPKLNKLVRFAHPPEKNGVVTTGSARREGWNTFQDIGFFRVSFSIKPAVFLAGGWADT
jgi:hypothetical protein